MVIVMLTVTHLVLQHISGIIQNHSDFYIGSTFRICSPISHISITRPLHQLIHDNGQAKHKYNVYHLWIRTGCNICIPNGYTLLAGKLIPARRPNDYSLTCQWFIPREMRCRQHQTIMASRDMQGHMRDKSLTNDRYIGVLSTKWTYMNQPLGRPHSLCMGEWDLGFICPKWRRILSGQYVAKLLSCRSSYIWLRYIVVKLSVLSFAPIVKPLRTRWVY